MPSERLRKILLTTGIVAMLGAAFGIIVGAYVVVATDLPQVDSLEEYQPKGVTVLKDVRGNVIHEFYRERRIPLRYEQIPKDLRQAFLAIEDWRFYDHFGLDIKGLFRAFAKNVVKRRYAEGASTITQQLSKVLFLTPEKTLRRKLKEALLAIQIERRYSKDEILTLYLNQIYLGSGCYGVEAAAKTYFNKTVSELNTAEMALIAGLPKAPSIYSPFRNPDKARHRRDIALLLMFQRGLLSSAELNRAREEPMPEREADDADIQSYFAAQVKKDLIRTVGEDQIYRGRLTVQTTLDLQMQKAAESAVANGIEAYATRHKIPLDDVEKLPQAALLAVDASNGEIRAMVGGRSFQESQFNRAVQARRQPGSSFKPIVAVTALERGFTQSSLMEDEPISFSNEEAGYWEPENYSKEYDGLIPLRIAMEKSKNVVAVRLLQNIGIPALKQMVNRLGIESPIAYNLSSALGSSSLRLPELARAYAAFANGGIRHHLRSIRNVYAKGDIDLWSPPPPSEQVIDPAVAYIMTDMLRGVVENGTARFARNLPCVVAGKTGTTNDYVDSFFAGFSPNLVAVTWVGFDDRKTLGFGETGARAAGRIWKEFMEYACRGDRDEFKAPREVMLVDVDHSSGKLPSRYCADITTQAYLKGTEPTHVCDEESIPRL